ncbi:hypothetical protein [Streptosporangium canum]|uniref:hypothetical protein n=1 Tax=Streptosporangium canum TaxID=324952 RepID=UPI003789FCDF
MAETLHKNPRIAMRHTRPGGEAVAGITCILTTPQALTQRKCFSRSHHCGF